MYRLEEHVLIENDGIDGKNYLLDLEAGIMFELNRTAFCIIECIKKNGNCDDYINEMVSQTNLPKEKIQSDCEKYVALLLERKYMKECVG